MKILKLYNAIMLCPFKEEAAINGAITIEIDGVKEGAIVSIVKNGKPETETKHIVNDRKISFAVEEGKYTIKIGKCKVRFIVCNIDGALVARQPKEDLEKTVHCLEEICIELFSEIQKSNKKIENLTGYDVIQ